MNWEIVSATGEWAGAFAVVVTLFYLASQIRSNVDIAKAQSQREMLNTFDIFAPIANSSDLGPIIREGLSDFESLTEDEKLRFHSWAQPLAIQVEATFRMYRQNMIEEPSYLGFRNTLLSMIATEGGKQWWVSAQNVIGRDFADEVNCAFEEETIVPMGDLVPFFVSQINAEKETT